MISLKRYTSADDRFLLTKLDQRRVPVYFVVRECISTSTVISLTGYDDYTKALEGFLADIIGWEACMYGEHDNLETEIPAKALADRLTQYFN